MKEREQRKKASQIHGRRSRGGGGGGGGAGPAIAGPIFEKNIKIKVLGNVSCCEYKTQHTYMCMYAHA